MRGSGRYLISSWQRTRRQKESLVSALSATENIGRGRKTSFSAQQAHRLTGAPIQPWHATTTTDFVVRFRLREGSETAGLSLLPEAE
jgi:hypothetical protein